MQKEEQIMDLKEMDFSKLSPELKAKAEKCKSMDELLDLAKSEGVDLTAEQLDYISGGGDNCYDGCPDHCRRNAVKED